MDSEAFEKNRVYELLTFFAYLTWSKFWKTPDFLRLAEVCQIPLLGMFIFAVWL
jgi:hypothetical protein